MMKGTKRVVVPTLTLLLLVLCGWSNVSQVDGANTTTTTTILEENLMSCATPEQVLTVEDFFPSKVSPQNADTWTVEYYPTYKLLTNIFVNETYVLYQCGTEPPTSDEVGKPFKFMTSIPLSDGVALTSTVQIPMFEVMGLSNEIKTYIGDTQYISSQCLLDRLSSGDLEDYDPTEVSDVSETAAAVLWQEQHPQRVVVDNQFMTSAGQGTSMTLIENGYKEAEPKAISEWLLFYSTLYNKERMAQTIHDETYERYECTAANAALTFGATDDTSKPKLKAVWAYWSNYPGYEGWLTAKCDTKHNYYCDFAKLCNVELLHQENGSLTDEQFEEWAKDVDIFFYSYTTWYDIIEQKPYLQNFKSVQNKQVYDTEGSGNFTWWEQRMIEFDVALEDFCIIANQTTDLVPHELHWFRNVFEHGPGEAPKDLKETHGVCVDGEPLMSRATNCTRLVETPTFGSSNGEDDTTTTTTTAGANTDSGAMSIMSSTTMFSMIGTSMFVAAVTTTLALV